MILSLLLAGMGTAATAQNINLPIIQTKYTLPILHLMCTTIRFISIPPTMRMGLKGS